MEIRTAALQDLDAVAAVEAACFPAVEAAVHKIFYGVEYKRQREEGQNEERKAPFR